jgi:CBS domain-containing protein
VPVPGVQVAGAAPDSAPASLSTAEQRPTEALAAYAQAFYAHTQSGGGERQPLGLVEQLMSRHLISVPLDASLAQGQALLARAGVGQAPVLNPRGHLVGLLMRADLLPQPEQLKDAASWRAWLARPVAEVMWTPVPSANPDTPIREAAQVLLDLRLPGLPVLGGDDQLLGFLSRSDILRALTREPPVDLWS